MYMVQISKTKTTSFECYLGNISRILRFKWVWFHWITLNLLMDNRYTTSGFYSKTGSGDIDKNRFRTPLSDNYSYHFDLPLTIAYNFAYFALKKIQKVFNFAELSNIYIFQGPRNQRACNSIVRPFKNCDICHDS